MTTPSALHEKERSDVAALLSSQVPTRVVVIVRGRSDMFGQEPLAIISDALSVLQLSVEYHFLVHERWPRLDFVVFDLFNTNYDWKTAHTPADLPVVLLDYGFKKLRVSIAAPMVPKETNDGVAHHHSLNGWHSHPPYVADHTLSQPPSYEAPRDMQWILPDGSTSTAEPNLLKNQ